MSMHKIPLTDLERSGLENHGLPIGKPSQLSDVFRQGVKHALSALAAQEPVCPDCGGTGSADSGGTLLFNPYSGKPRHPSDIASDPHGILMVEPDALTRAAKKIEPTDWAAS